MTEAAVKVCGLTRREDVALASGLGAWAVGFVLAPSPRRVTTEQARELADVARACAARSPHGRRPLALGVFVDASAEEIADAVVVADLDAVQLHAPRPGAAAVRAALGERARDILVIQTVAVPAEGASSAALKEAVASLRKGADLLLFDTSSGGRSGGTGVTFPWDLAREAGAGLPFLVAGGLGPQNVAQALAASGAFGADVSSGVESAPGVKDHAALRALFAALEEPSEGRGR